MVAIASQIHSLAIVYSTVYSDADQENIKAPRHWPLWGEFTGEFLAQMASNAENVSFDDVIMRLKAGLAKHLSYLVVIIVCLTYMSDVIFDCKYW